MIANARVSIKSDSTGVSNETQSDSSGKYSVGNLAPGDYVVSVQIAGFDAKTSNVGTTSSTPQILDFVLIATMAPNAPSPAPASPSLQDQPVHVDLIWGPA
jgi:Carboxypeptidase regulatory-like domain